MLEETGKDSRCVFGTMNKRPLFVRQSFLGGEKTSRPTRCFQTGALEADLIRETARSGKKSQDGSSFEIELRRRKFPGPCSNPRDSKRQKRNRAFCFGSSSSKHVPIRPNRQRGSPFLPKPPP